MEVSVKRNPCHELDCLEVFPRPLSSPLTTLSISLTHLSFDFAQPPTFRFQDSVLTLSKDVVAIMNNTYDSALFSDSLASVVKLQGEDNWVLWSSQLRIAMDRVDKDWWKILTGEMTAPTEPVYNSDTGEQADNVVDHSDDDQFKRDSLQHDKARHEYQTAVELWKDKNTRAFAFFALTLSNELQVLIYNLECPREAFVRLKSMYCNDSWESACNRFWKWTSLRFDKGMSAPDFVHQFKKALGDLLAVVPQSSISPAMQFFTFIEAVRGHPHTRYFMVNLTVESYNAQTMSQTYLNFMSSVKESKWDSRNSRKIRR